MNLFKLTYFYQGDKVGVDELSFKDKELIVNLDFFAALTDIRKARDLETDEFIRDYACVTMSNGDNYFISTESREYLIEKLNELDNGYGDL